MKTFAEILREENERKKMKERKTGYYGLSSMFEKNPRTYCPECLSPRLKNLTDPHDTDTEVFECRNCGFCYRLCYDQDDH